MSLVDVNKKYVLPTPTAERPKTQEATIPVASAPASQTNGVATSQNNPTIQIPQNTTQRSNALAAVNSKYGIGTTPTVTQNKIEPVQLTTAQQELSNAKRYERRKETDLISNNNKLKYDTYVNNNNLGWASSALEGINNEDDKKRWADMQVSQSRLTQEQADTLLNKPKGDAYAEVRTRFRNGELKGNEPQGWNTIAGSVENFISGAGRDPLVLMARLMEIPDDILYAITGNEKFNLDDGRRTSTALQESDQIGKSAEEHLQNSSKFGKMLGSTARAAGSMFGTSTLLGGALKSIANPGVVAGLENTANASSLLNQPLSRLGAKTALEILNNTGNAAISLSSGVNSYSEALANGADIGQAFSNGLYKGLAEYFSNKLFSGTPFEDSGEKGYVTKLTEYIANKLGKSDALRVFNESTGGKVFNWISNKTGEGLEEVVTGIADPVIDKLTYNWDADLATVDSLTDEFISGVMLSLLMSGGEAVINGMRKSSVNGEVTGKDVSDYLAEQGFDSNTANKYADGLADSINTVMQTGDANTVTPTETATATNANATAQPTLTNNALPQAVGNATQNDTALPTQDTAAQPNAIVEPTNALEAQATASTQQNVAPQQTMPEQTVQATPTDNALPKGTGAAEAGFTGNTERGFSRNIATDLNMNEELRTEYREDPEMYNRLGNSETLEKAQEIYDRDESEARADIEKILASEKLPPAYAVPLTRMLANKMAARGDVFGAKQLTARMAERLTEAGQFTQAANILRNADPATVEQTISGILDKINEAIIGKKGTSQLENARQSVDFLIQSRQDALNLISEIYNVLNKEGNANTNSWVEQLGKDLAQKLGSKAKSANDNTATVYETLLGDLEKFANEFLPKTEQTATRTAIERIADFYNNRAEYAKAWEEAQKRLKEKYGDTYAQYGNYGSFDDFIKSAIDYGTQLTQTAIRDEMKSIGIKMKDIISQSAGTKAEIADKIATTLTTEYNFSEADAADFSKKVVDTFNNMVQDSANKRLASMFRIVQKSKNQQKSIEQKVRELYNLGAFQSDDYIWGAANKIFGIDKLNKSGFIAELTQDEMRQIWNTDFSQEGAFDQVYEQIMQRIGREMPSTLWDKLTEIRRISMLLNPKTLERNIIGNVPTAILRKASQKVAGVIQDGLVKLGKLDIADQTRTAKVSKESKDLAKSVWAEHKAEIMDSSDRYDAKSLINKYRLYFGNDPKNILDQFRKLTYSALEVGDAPFLKSAFVDSLAQYCEAQGITTAEGVTQEAYDHAIKDAYEATFRDASTVAQLLNKLKRQGGISGGVLDLLFPFTTTPINIAKRAVDYSPFGFAELLSKNKADSTTSKIDIVSKASVGTLAILVGFLMRGLGWITGSKDEKKGDWEQATGKSKFSILGKVSYEWIQPFGACFAIGADAFDIINKENPSVLDVAESLLTSAGDTFLDMTFFQNIEQLFSGYDSGTKNIMYRVMESFASQLVPSPVASLAQTIDPIVRSTRSNKPGLAGELETIGMQTMAKIPGLSFLLPESVNVKGETNRRPDNIALRIFDRFINPANVNYNSMNDVDKYFDELYKKTGDSSFLPNYADKSIASVNLESTNSSTELKDGEDKLTDYRYTAKEYEQVQKTYGQTYYSIVDSLMNDTSFMKLSASQQINILGEARKYALDTAKRECIDARVADTKRQYTSSWDKTYALIDDGIDIDEVLLFKNFTGTAKADKDKNGKSISGSKKEKILDYIYARNDLTKSEKEQMIEVFTDYKIN